MGRRGAKDDARFALGVARAPARVTIAFLPMVTARTTDEGLFETLLAIAAHDLRGPLGTVQLSLQSILHQRAGLEGRTRDRIATAEREAATLARRIDDLLLVARIAAGKVTLERASHDLGALADGTCDRFTGEARAHGSTIAVDAPPGIAGRWDARLLDVALGHVVQNAVRFGAGKPIDVRVTATATRARIVVRDRGPGVPADHRERIFERVERAAEGRRTGRGLGLWIARRVVAMHEGTISCEAPSDGEGAQFVIELPRGARSGRHQRLDG